MQVQIQQCGQVNLNLFKLCFLKKINLRKIMNNLQLHQKLLSLPLSRYAPSLSVSLVSFQPGPDFSVSTFVLILDFQADLTLLFQTLNKANRHYVRCLKPNNDKLPNLFDGAKVLEQLKSNGVLGTTSHPAPSAFGLLPGRHSDPRNPFLTVSSRYCQGQKERLCSKISIRRFRKSLWSFVWIFKT